MQHQLKNIEKKAGKSEREFKANMENLKDEISGERSRNEKLEQRIQLLSSTEIIKKDKIISDLNKHMQQLETDLHNLKIEKIEQEKIFKTDKKDHQLTIEHEISTFEHELNAKEAQIAEYERILFERCI